VVAADVSAPPAKAGRAGWTWYTGAAGWMYRVWIEEVLGFRLRGDRLTIAPVIPNDWNGFEITYRYRSTVYGLRSGARIHMRRCRIHPFSSSMTAKLTR